LASGATAKQYNLRKGRTGSMWQHPYHCTMVEDGRHLLNCCGAPSSAVGIVSR